MNEFNLPRTASEHSNELVIQKTLAPVPQEQPRITSIIPTLQPGGTDIEDIHALSAFQEAILHDALTSERSNAYVISTLLEVESQRNLDAFVDSLNKVAGRCDFLRSAVLWEAQSRPVLVVHRQATVEVVPIPVADGCDLQQELKEWIARGAFPVFELTHAPLLRLYFAEDPRCRRGYAVLQVHRLVCDEYGMDALIAAAIVGNDGLAMAPPLSLPLELRSLEAAVRVPAEDAEEFFRGKLAGIDGPTTLFGSHDPSIDESHIERAERSLDPALAGQIRTCAARCSSSARALLHAAWSLVVARASGRDDIVFGIVTSAPSMLQVNGAIGPFANTLPLRLDLSATTAAGLLHRVHHELHEIQRLGSVPLPVVLRCSGLDVRLLLLSSVVNYRTAAPQVRSEARSTTAIHLRAQAFGTWPNGAATLTIVESGDDFLVTVRAQSCAGASRILDHLLCALHSLLSALEVDPATPVVALETLPEVERLRLVQHFNPQDGHYPAAKLIHEAFEEQVVLTPGAKAVVCGADVLTFEELNRRANQLAHYLCAHGLRADEPVALFVDRHVATLIGVMAILKAGGCYVPIDPIYPLPRLLSILEDAQPRLVLTQGSLQHVFTGVKVEVIAIEEAWLNAEQCPAENPAGAADGLRSDNLAYVIYTSGSTGRPKGVMIEHRNVMSLWQGLEQIYHASLPCQRVAVNASFSFDASVKQLVQLLSGRTLVLIPQEIRRDPPALVRYLQEHEVDAIDCTPSQLRAWMSAGLLTEGPHNLRLVLIGGEPIDADLWRALATLSTTHFYNVYGPTESTVDATFACLNGDYSAPHIGRPMLNRSIYILDKHSRPLPIGVAGELYIGGAGVARGYLKRARLTSECFVADPFHPDPAARMYKTGDIARWRADGTIDYLGRNDQQVKIRGFRVELGEIEVHLRRIDEVQQVAVITREDTPGHVLLVAYFVPRDRAAPPSAAELRMRLQAVLPDYMVPNAFVELQQIPLNQNGKLDRKALPAPGAVAFCERQYRAPVGEVEEAVASIWQTILGAQEIGRHESFFDLGGHSLSATQVVSRIQALFCVEIPVSTVFDLPRLSDLARRVEELRSSHLLRRVVQGVGEMEEELRSRVAALTDAEVQKLLDELPTEERR